MANPTVTLEGNWDSGFTSSAVSSKSVARDLAVSAGDVLIVCVLGNQDNNVTSVVDGQFGTLSTYSGATNWDATHSTWMQFFWGTATQSYSASPSNNITANFSSLTGYAEVIAAQFRCSSGYVFASTSNVLGSSVNDGPQNAPGTGAGAILSGATNFSATPMFAFAASIDNSGSGGQTVANGWTSTFTGNSGNWVPSWTVPASTGGQEASWTASASGGGDTYQGMLIGLNIVTSTGSVTVTSVNSGSAVSEGATGVAFIGTGFASGMTASIVQSLNGVADATVPQGNVVYVDATDGKFDLVMEPTGPQLAFTDSYYTHSLQVTVSGSSGSGAIAGLAPPPGLLFVTLTSVNSTSSYRITAAPDVAVYDQLEVAGDAIGSKAAPAGLTLNADGTFLFAQTYPPQNFWVRAYDSTDHTWGGWAEQTVSNVATVPDVSGLTIPAAEAALSNAGFSYWSVSYETSTTVPAGDAIATLPQAGSSVSPTTDIIIYVSSGVGPPSPPTPPQPVTTGERILPQPTAMLATTIPAYPYQQYADDDDIQAFFSAYNAATQTFVTWLVEVGLPYYPALSGDLLDWVANGLFGTERTSLAQTQTPVSGPLNTQTLNNTSPEPATAPPTANTPTSSGTTGLPAGTYYYVVTSTSTGSESVRSNEVTITTAGASDITITWSAVSGASGYNVYRGTASGAENTFYAVSGGSTTTFTDTGAAGSNGSPVGFSTALNAFTAPTTTYYDITDDVFKRILTWNLYKGDGKRFTMKWLKRRIMRFLVGENGVDPNPLDPAFIIGPENTQAISVTVSSDTLTVTINGAALSGLVQVQPGIPEVFKAAFLGGVLDLPVQYTYACNIVTTMTASVSPTSESTSGVNTTLTTGTASVSALGGDGAYTYAWTWSSGGTGITINSPSSADTSFTATGMSRGTTLSGTAKCTVTDTASHSSDAYVNVTITNVSVPTVSLSPTSLSVSGSASSQITSSVTANVTGGQSPYTYAWTWQSGGSGITINEPSGSATSCSASNLSPGQTDSGTMLCTVTDSLGQQATATCPVSISRVSGVTATCSPTSETTSSSTLPITTGSTTVFASGGSGTYTYAWSWQSGGGNLSINSKSSNSTSFTASGMSPGQDATGIAQCVVKDSYGQTATTTCSVSVTYLPPLTHTFTNQNAMTETIPSGYSQMVIEDWGPGGHGGGGTGVTGGYTGGGGGSGGYVRKTIALSSADWGKTIDISATNGTANTVVSSGTLSIPTLTAGAGQNGTNGTDTGGFGTPGLGGTASGGDSDITGNSGNSNIGGSAVNGVYGGPYGAGGNGNLNSGVPGGVGGVVIHYT